MIYDFDGFEDYATAGLLRENLRASGACAIVSGGRNSGNRLRCQYGYPSGYVCRAVPAAPQTVVVGFYGQQVSLGSRAYFLEFRDATRAHVMIGVNTDGSVFALRSSQAGDFDPSGGTELGTSRAGVINADIPFLIQVAVTISDSAGSVEIRVNGVQVLTISPDDTRNAGTETVTNILVGAGYGPGGTYLYVDDLWIASDFLGDRRVDSHFPVNDGANRDGVPKDAGDHCEMVDESPEPDDDTSYVTLAAADDRESYGIEAFKNPGATIDAVLVVLDAKKEAAGAALVAAHIHGPGSPGADYDGTAQGLATDYTRLKEVYETVPGSGSPGSPWDETVFNSAEFGCVKAL